MDSNLGSKSCAAFTLIELLMVIVIIGLIVGGVMVGGSLIKAAELRSITAEFTKMQSAVNQFRSLYTELPGDLTRATLFWGAAHGDPGTCRYTPSTTTATCRGNGNWSLTFTSFSNEPFAFWKHLENAGLWPGSYTGAGVVGSHLMARAGHNVPASGMDGVMWSVVHLNIDAGSSTYYRIGDVGNTLNRNLAPTSNASGGPAAFTPLEAKDIDTKIDDGRPAYGRMFTNYNNN